ncbi:MAG: nuclear transport factor 2 family protein [Pseudomonadota bacterium]
MQTSKSTLFIRSLVVGAIVAIAGCAATEERAQKQAFKSEVMQGQETLAVAKAFLGAAGSGDMQTLKRLMADDFVWHNEGDSSIPWIGTWDGKEVVLTKFLPAFGAGLKTTSWSTDYEMAMGDQAIFMGTMGAIANASGAETGEFSWAVRVHVVDGQVKSWNWFEDSYAVSKAFHTSDN